MPLTPQEKIALCTADLERCDYFLGTFWNEDTRREVQVRRKALIKICEQEAESIGMEFLYPDEPAHPRYANL